MNFLNHFTNDAGIGRGAFIGDVLKGKKASNSQVIRLLY